eukprot:3307159-Prymnesium_polylepis.1
MPPLWMICVIVDGTTLAKPPHTKVAQGGRSVTSLTNLSAYKVSTRGTCRHILLDCRHCRTVGTVGALSAAVGTVG